MGLEYCLQTEITCIGSKTEAGVLTAATLPTFYDFDGTTTKAFTTGGMSKMELNGKYTAGTGETANSVQIIVEDSFDGVNYYRLLNESVSGGTSTLTQREFTITQVTTYGTLAYDAQSANFTAGLKVTGGTSSATGYIETDTDAGSTGTLLLSNVSGTFQDNEAITDSSTGAATVNGILTSITTFALPLDISNRYIRVSAKETGVASNAGTLSLTAIISGE